MRIKEFFREWGSCLGLIVSIGLMSGLGFIALRIDEAERRASELEAEGRVLMRLEGTTFQVWSGTEERSLVAEIDAETIEFNEDLTHAQIYEISGVRVYRESEPYMRGTARRASYDEQLQELRVFDSVRLEGVKEDLSLATEELVYYIDPRLIVVTQPLTATLRDATLKTPTARMNVNNQRFMAPRQVVVNTADGGQVVADSASGDLEENVLSLVGNVVMDTTVQELQELAEETQGEGESAESAPAPGARQTGKVRIRCGRADFDLKGDRATARDGVTIVGEEGSAMGQTAELEKTRVTLGGGTTLTLRDKAGGGPITVETPLVEYDTETDLAVCPSPVTVTLREGRFTASRAQARLKAGTWRLQGGVKGTLIPSV